MYIKNTNRKAKPELGKDLGSACNCQRISMQNNFNKEKPFPKKF